MKKYIKKALKNIAACLLATVTAVAIFAPAFTRFKANAETVDEKPLDSTKISEDLKDLGDLATTFPAEKDGELQLVNFTEYCYSSTTSEDFALYLYVYNPAQFVFTKGEINMATEYEGGKPSAYENLDLKLCKHTDDHLLYKFRIVESVKTLYDMANLWERTSSARERRYDLAGIQLVQMEGDGVDLTLRDPLETVEDYAVSKTFYFSGYAKGYGAEEESTLKSRYEDLTTVKLNLHHTNYRMDDPYKGNSSVIVSYDSNGSAVTAKREGYIYEEVNSVYFSIPKEILEKYPNFQLSAIDMEWYEYQTKPIFVTSDKNAHNALIEYVGVNIGDGTSELPWRVMWDEYVLKNIFDEEAFYYYALYNQEHRKSNWVFDNLKYYWFMKTADRLEQIDWLFYVESPKNLKDYEVSRAEVEAWAEEYADKCVTSGQKVEAKKQNYPVELFENVQDGENPYKKIRITQTDGGDLREYKEQSFWEKFFGKKPKSKEVADYTSIKEVTTNDLIYTDSVVCDNLLINENDYKQGDGMNNPEGGFYGWAKGELESGNTPYLIRFDNTDYYAQKARFDKKEAGNTEVSNYDGYVCQQKTYLDLDVISLEFSDGEETVVLGAVATPIDIFNGTTPPTKLPIPRDDDCTTVDFKKVLGIVLVVVGIFLLIKVFKWVGRVMDKKTMRDVRKELKKRKRNKK
ncbi:MAG: hypothetical protein IJD33_01990 [Clostridia bacterium]|nr:hypothetical protein [Clostridia bacterium]